MKLLLGTGVGVGVEILGVGVGVESREWDPTLVWSQIPHPLMGLLPGFIQNNFWDVLLFISS